MKSTKKNSTPTSIEQVRSVHTANEEHNHDTVRAQYEPPVLHILSNARTEDNVDVGGDAFGGGS